MKVVFRENTLAKALSTYVITSIHNRDAVYPQAKHRNGFRIIKGGFLCRLLNLIRLIY